MLLKLLQEIPTHWQGTFPTHEDNRNWLWFSRLAFHSSRASASRPILEGEVAKEEEIANWEEEANTRMIIRTVVNIARIRLLMQLGSGFSSKEIMTYKVASENRNELGNQRRNGFMVMCRCLE